MVKYSLNGSEGVRSKLDTLIRHSALKMFSQSMNITEEHKQR